MPKSRVIMIGWDGADRATIEQWMQDGLLPNLASLRSHGAFGQIESLPGLGDDACWGSFATGTGPAVHGRFHYRQIVPGTYRQSSFFRNRMIGKPFWTHLSDAGQRVAIVDVPKCPLAEHLNGVQIADWLPHGADGPVPVSWPPALANELSAVRNGTFNCHWTRTSTTEFETLRGQIDHNLAARAELALDWLRREPWDLFLAVFAESHCIGHHYWHLHDVDHPDYDADAATRLGNPMRDVHQALDTALGRIFNERGPETTVIVFSLIGMGPNYMGTWLADTVLRRLEPGIVARSMGASRPRSKVRRLLSRLAPPSIRAAVKDFDMANRSAFIVPFDASSTAIRLNLMGREPHGKVQPGDYAAHCEFLTESFSKLVDPDSGRPLVTQVVNVAQQFPGIRASGFADLLVVWSHDAPIHGVASDSIGVVRGTPPHDRSGNHRAGGWFAALGPGVAKGEIDRPVAIVDFAPTVGRLLGTTSRHLEGTPIGALVN